jgi:Pyridoxamine 5'-phosphate oxidase
MRETAADLERLQRLLDDSARRASPFLRASFQIPARSLSAERLADRLDGGLTVALGTVTAGGEPRVAPIAAFFVHASFYVPTVAESARARHLARRPAVSLTYFEGTALAVIAHGNAEILDGNDPPFAELDAIQVEIGNQSVRQWHGTGIYLHVSPATLYTYERLAPTPAQ